MALLNRDPPPMLDPAAPPCDDAWGRAWLLSCDDEKVVDDEDVDALDPDELKFEFSLFELPAAPVDFGAGGGLIMSVSLAMASSRPSPVTAHVGWRFQALPLTPSSRRPRHRSSLAASMAEGRSCLLAKTRTGICCFLQPPPDCRLDEAAEAVGTTGLALHMFCSSNLASSRLSSLDESTTKMMPSVHRV